ncbi:hypothetical protein KW794_00515 [Candidatus Saccharibacteria bacterium]|nr:hypothetical protein [Candidatus Saccharibacteria bacterium]
MKNSFWKRYYWVPVILLALTIFQFVRPLTEVSPQSQLPQPSPVQAVDIPWPAGGQSALGAKDYGLLALNGASSPVPIGSTAKVITALAILQKKPITANGQGAILTLTKGDVDLYNHYYSLNGSGTLVSAGEQITELQALQSMLIPSSNNMADTLAVWAFGDIDSYLAYANTMVKKDLKMNQTSIGDTNGFSDTTTSTADDLVRLGLAAMDNPVISKIVSQPTAEVPVAGILKNTNILLGSNGVIGIKTGHTDMAGGCYLFAADRSITGHTVTIVGAILGQPSLAVAISSAPSLLMASDAGFELTTIAHKDQTLGFYETAWGAKAQFQASKDLTLLIWRGAETKITSQLDSSGAAKAGTTIGRITVSNLQQSTNTSLVLANNLQAPSPIWRLTRH